MGVRAALKECFHTTKLSDQTVNSFSASHSPQQRYRDEPEDFLQFSHNDPRQGGELAETNATGQAPAASPSFVTGALQQHSRGWYCNRKGQSAYLNGATKGYPCGPFQQPPDPATISLHEALHQDKYGSRGLDIYHSDGRHLGFGGTGYSAYQYL